MRIQRGSVVKLHNAIGKVTFIGKLSQMAYVKMEATGMKYWVPVSLLVHA